MIEYVESLVQKSTPPINEKGEIRDALAKVAGVSHDTYSKGK